MSVLVFLGMFSLRIFNEMLDNFFFFLVLVGSSNVIWAHKFLD